MSNARLKKVSDSLRGNTYLVLPMVVEKEYTLHEIRDYLQRYGFSYSDNELMRYLTSSYFRKCLTLYLEIIGMGHVNPEYYIELYIFP